MRKFLLRLLRGVPREEYASLYNRLTRYPSPLRPGRMYDYNGVDYKLLSIERSEFAYFHFDASGALTECTGLRVELRSEPRVRPPVKALSAIFTNDGS